VNDLVDWLATRPSYTNQLVDHRTLPAREAHGEIMVGKFPFSASGRALTMDKPSGYVKVIADSDEQLLGVRIVGARGPQI